MFHATRTRSTRSHFRFRVVVQAALIGGAVGAGCADAETVPPNTDTNAAGTAAVSGSVIDADSSSSSSSSSSTDTTDSDSSVDNGSSGSSTDHGDATLPPPAVDLTQPYYEVPVSDSLTPFARYPVGSVNWAVKGGRRRLEYQLPADLLGTAQMIEFKGPDTTATTWSLTGENFGTADCSLSDQQVVCQEHLAGIPIDIAAVEARVNAGQLAPQRLDVAKVFQGDPIGVLRFPAN
jgi:hypothetical protein